MKFNYNKSRGKKLGHTVKNNDLKINRYIIGLRVGCMLFILSSVFFLCCYLAFPELNPSEDAYRINIFRHIISIAFLSLIIIFLNRKMYLVFLILTILWFYFDTFYFAAKAFELNHEAWNIYAIYGAKFLDYVFMFIGLWCVIALCFANFYATLALVIASLLNIVPPLYTILSIPTFYFTTDPKTIISDPMAMNQYIFIGNIQVSAIIVLATIWIAWRLEKVTDDAARQERSSVTLGRYFSPDIRQEIENESSLDTKSGKEKKVAILFTDIVGFTKLSENMEPNQVLELLSKYQTKMVDAIFANGGTVDKFIGDSVMATFGTPVSRGNDAQNALNCAKEMQLVMDKWDSDTSVPSNLKIKHRIGIHYGNCFAGNAGSDQRVEYTVIGDAVNLASRICEACKEVGCNFLISDDFMRHLSEKPKSEVIKNFSIRGRKEKVDLHKVIF